VEVAHTTKVCYYPAPNPTYFGFAYHMDFRATSYCVEYDCAGDPTRKPKDIVQDLLH
jgi:hypothetical protein